MRIIIENNGIRREINTSFKIYVKAEDLRLIYEAVSEALAANLNTGWITIGNKLASKDTVLYPWDATAEEKPVYPWAKA